MGIEPGVWCEMITICIHLLFGEQFGALEEIVKCVQAALLRHLAFVVDSGGRHLHLRYETRNVRTYVCVYVCVSVCLCMCNCVNSVLFISGRMMCMSVCVCDLFSTIFFYKL